MSVAVSARIVPTRGAPLVVYATILPWLGSSWRDVRAVIGEAFAALNLQARDWNTLRAAHPDHDLILAGDFNQDLTDSHYHGSHDNRRRLVEALQTTGLIPLTSGGEDPVRRDSPPMACIDHICITRCLAGAPVTLGDGPTYRRPTVACRTISASPSISRRCEPFACSENLDDSVDSVSGIAPRFEAWRPRSDVCRNGVISGRCGRILVNPAALVTSNPSREGRIARLGPVCSHRPGRRAGSR